MAIVTRHGLRAPNALAIMPWAMRRYVPLPSYRWSKPKSLTHHTINPLAAAAGWGKRRGIPRQNPSPGATIWCHPSTTTFPENLKSP